MAATRRASTPATLVRYSIVPRLSLIGLHAARAAASSFASVAVVQRVADQRVGRVLHQQHGRRHRTQRHTRRGADALVVQRHADAAADHGDIHFRARNEPQIGIAGARRPRRELELQDELVLGQRWCGRVRWESAPPAPRAVPLLPTTTAIAPAAYSAGTLSAAGEALHRLPASEQRPWICVEPIRSSASTTPGHALFMPACASTIGARRRGADHEAAAFLADADDAGNLLGVDDQFRLQPAGSHLHEKVGPSGKDLRQAGCAGQQFDGLIDRRGCGVIECWHSCSRYLRVLSCPVLKPVQAGRSQG